MNTSRASARGPHAHTTTVGEVPRGHCTRQAWRFAAVIAVLGMSLVLAPARINAQTPPAPKPVTITKGSDGTLAAPAGTPATPAPAKTGTAGNVSGDKGRASTGNATGRPAAGAAVRPRVMPVPLRATDTTDIPEAALRPARPSSDSARGALVDSAIAGNATVPTTGTGSVAAPRAADTTTHRASSLKLSPPNTRVAVRRRAVVYSDWYTRRATIHKAASFTTLPLFAAQYVAGAALMKDGANAPEWARKYHGKLAGGVAGLFAVNTLTGGWNLWDGRHDPAGRKLRLLHGLLMLSADAGFAYTGAIADRAAQSQALRDRHRQVALGSLGVATFSYLLMLPPFRRD